MRKEYGEVQLQAVDIASCANAEQDHHRFLSFGQQPRGRQSAKLATERSIVTNDAGGWTRRIKGRGEGYVDDGKAKRKGSLERMIQQVI